MGRQRCPPLGNGDRAERSRCQPARSRGWSPATSLCCCPSEASLALDGKAEGTRVPCVRSVLNEWEVVGAPCVSAAVPQGEAPGLSAPGEEGRGLCGLAVTAACVSRAPGLRLGPGGQKEDSLLFSELARTGLTANRFLRPLFPQRLPSGHRGGKAEAARPASACAEQETPGGGAPRGHEEGHAGRGDCECVSAPFKNNALLNAGRGGQHRHAGRPARPPATAWTGACGAAADVGQRSACAEPLRSGPRRPRLGSASRTLRGAPRGPAGMRGGLGAQGASSGVRVPSPSRWQRASGIRKPLLGVGMSPTARVTESNSAIKAGASGPGDAQPARPAAEGPTAVPGSEARALRPGFSQPVPPPRPPGP